MTRPGDRLLLRLLLLIVLLPLSLPHASEANKHGDMRILSFEPKNGPVNGGTRIRLEGRRLRTRFKPESSSLDIRIGKAKTTILDWADDFIECRTEEIDMETSSQIRLHFTKKGSTTEEKLRTTQHFNLFKPILYDFEPNVFLGTKGKEIQVKIRGQNLNIGNHREVRLWSGDCEIQTNDGNTLYCHLKSFRDPKDMSDKERNRLHMTIDGWRGSLIGKVDDFLPLFGDYSRFLKRQENSGIGRVLLILGISLLALIPVAVAAVYAIRKIIRKQSEAAVMLYGTSPDKTHPETIPMKPAAPYDVVDNHRISMRSGLSQERNSLMHAIDEADMACLNDLKKVIAIEHLRIEEEIGKGHYGLVFRGKLYISKTDESVDVAIKTVHGVGQGMREVHSFFQEALLMKDFEHENILTLIGVSFTREEGLPLVILPYMARGNLLFFLRDQRLQIPMTELIRMSLDVARGMAYLEANRVVHRDLAARNCLLDHDMCVKVCDFGLSRDVYQRDYYRSRGGQVDLPIPWMAPESLEFQQFSSKSDVWSFGVVVWELMTRGKVPYNYTNLWEIKTVLKCGHRLERPEQCPAFLYDLMMRCWTWNPDERPSFADIVNEIPVRLQQQKSECCSRSTSLDPLPEAEYENCGRNDATGTRQDEEKEVERRQEHQRESLYMSPHSLQRNDRVTSGSGCGDSANNVT